MTHFQEIRWANDLDHIRAHFRQYLRVMEHWRKVLPAPLLEIDYERTVDDLEGVARQLVAFCGLPWEPGCLDFHLAKRAVTTASSVQIRQPVYKNVGGKMAELRTTAGVTFRPAGALAVTVDAAAVDARPDQAELTISLMLAAHLEGFLKRAVVRRAFLSQKPRSNP